MITRASYIRQLGFEMVPGRFKIARCCDGKMPDKGQPPVCFLFWPNLCFHYLKWKWNTWIKPQVSRANGQARTFFPWMKITNHLHKISFSTLLSSCTITYISDLQMRLQVGSSPGWKSLSIWCANFRNFQPNNFWLN